MKIFQYAATMDNWFKSNLSENGYEAFTTFYSDLTIAEVMGGEKAVKDTIKNVLKSWMTDIKYITEFCMALNYKSWEMDMWKKQGKTNVNGKDIDTLLNFYVNQYYAVRDKIYKHYADNEKALSYFYNTTD